MNFVDVQIRFSSKNGLFKSEFVVFHTLKPCFTEEIQGYDIGVLHCCLQGVIGVLHRQYRGVTGVLKRCYMGVTGLLEICYSVLLFCIFLEF